MTAGKPHTPEEDMEDVFKDVLHSLSQLPGVIGHIGEIMTQFAESMNPLLIAVADLLATASLSHADHGGGSPTPGGGAPAASGAGSLAGVAKVAAVAAAALGVMVVAVQLAEHQFRKLEGFVRLFNPGVVTTFRHAMDNLGATIGRAFIPVFQNATEVVRQWAGILAPVMSQLAPVIKAVSDLMANTLMRALTQLGAVFRAAIPIFKVFMEVFGLVAEVATAVFNALGQFLRAALLIARVFYELSGMGLVVRVLTKLFEGLNVVMRVLDEALSIIEVVVTTLVDSLLAWIGSLLPFGDIMGSLNRAVEYVIRNMYVWAVLLAKMAGAMGVVDALIAHVEGKLKTGDVAAQQPQIKSLEQLSKDLALAAAAAGGAAGAGGVRNQQEFWQKTLDEMRAAKANGMTIRDFLQSILDELKTLAANAVPAPVANAVNGAVAVAGGIVSPENPRGAMAGGIVGGVFGGPIGVAVGRYVGGRQ